MPRWSRQYRLTRKMEAEIRARLVRFDEDNPVSDKTGDDMYDHMTESRRTWQRHENEHSFRAGFLQGAWALEDLIRQRR